MMSARRARKPKLSPVDPADITRLRIADMMRNLFPGWPAEGLERVIYEAQGPKGFADLLGHFIDELPNGITDSGTETVVSILQEAWNNLPHKSLGDRSPAELLRIELEQRAHPRSRPRQSAARKSRLS